VCVIASTSDICLLIGSVEIVDHTSAKAVINVVLRSRDVLAQLTDALLDNASFPVRARGNSIWVCALTLCASPISASWDMNCTCWSSMKALYERLWLPAKRSALPTGYRESSLRLEKHYVG
jgi:hypothetical protein